MMIPQHGYHGLVNSDNEQPCECTLCVPIGSDWSELSNTEKLAKMIIFKAQLAADENAKQTVI